MPEGLDLSHVGVRDCGGSGAGQAFISGNAKCQITLTDMGWNKIDQASMQPL